MGGGKKVSSTIGPDERASLCEFLDDQFGLDELKGLAYDLGTGFDLYSHKTGSRLAFEWVGYLERRGRLGCLLDVLIRQGCEGDWLPLADRVPPCPPRFKAQVTCSTDWSSVDVSALKDQIAACCRVPANQVEIVGAAGPDVRLLVSLPEYRADGSRVGGASRFQDLTFEPLEELDRGSQRTWRVVACQWPPRWRGGRLQPTASWPDVRRGSGGRRAWAIAAGATFFLAAGFWIYDRFVPRIPAAREGLQATWAKLKVGWSSVVLWLEFLGSISLSAIALSWTTALLFGLLAVVVYLIPGALRLLARVFPRSQRLARMRDVAPRTLKKHDRWVGTALNLSSSVCALFLVSWIVQRPLDYWDLGIQCAIALIIELVVLGVASRTGLFARLGL